MRLEEDVKLDYKDVLIRPKRSTLKSRSQVKLHRKFQFRNYDHDIAEPLPDDIHYNGIPIMASNMDGVGTFEMADKIAEGEIFTCLVKTYSAEELIDFFNAEDVGLERTENVAMSIGTGDSDYNKLIQVKKECDYRLKYVCMDIAHGYSDHFAQHVRKVRSEFPDLVIIAGNVVTREMTEELILAGADIVKVGIGPGSVCTTRIQTGVGYPQLSAVIECADAAHGLGGHIIADGGCTCPGDVAKAFAAGADFVMLGGMLAGHDEGGGDVITKSYITDEFDTQKQTRIFKTKQFVQFYGMSSESANDKHFGGLKDYRSSEGRTVLVPYRGPVAKTVQEILGGVRSACTYVGAMKLKQLSKCATFIRCTQTHNSVYESSTIGK
jgi:GMP reductase